MKNKILLLIIFFLTAGAIFRLIYTQNGNFIFNMDNARDMVDVREMVVLNKPRLIGNTAAIEGVFYGPYWYYLLAIPFALSGGNPYASIVLQIVLWVIGGYFVLKLVSKFGIVATVIAGALWIASDFLILSTSYSFNPNPVLFLSPLLIFLFDKYLKLKKSIYSVTSFALAATFLSNEILFAMLLPIILIAAIIFTKNSKVFKLKSFWLGILAFLIVSSPHLFFELRHNFFMTQSLIHFFTTGGDTHNSFNLLTRVTYVISKFDEILRPTFFNNKILSYGFVILFFAVVGYILKKRQPFQDNLFVILCSYILIPVIAFIIIPVNINSWHWVGVIAALVIIAGYLLATGLKLTKVVGLYSTSLLLLVIAFSISNVFQYVSNLDQPRNDPSLFRNELSAIDFVYKQANGKNFKVYTYLPSVIDYPYQYLFWWRGLNKYGYLPQDYAYEPNKPAYIAQKEKLDIGTHPESSGLIFLIKEPDRGLRHLWENTFKKYSLLTSQIVGPLVIETRQDINKQ